MGWTDSKSRGPQARVGSIPTSGTNNFNNLRLLSDLVYTRFSPDCDKKSRVFLTDGMKSGYGFPS